MEPKEYKIEPRKMKVETPFGSIESDSGSHAFDIFSVCLIIAFFFIIKKIVN